MKINLKHKLYIWVAAIAGIGLGCGTIIPIIVYLAKSHYDIRIDSNTRFDVGSEYYQYLNKGYTNSGLNYNDEQFQQDLKSLTKKQWEVEIAYSVWFATNMMSSARGDNLGAVFVLELHSFQKRIVKDHVEIKYWWENIFLGNKESIQQKQPYRYYQDWTSIESTNIPHPQNTNFNWCASTEHSSTQYTYLKETNNWVKKDKNSTSQAYYDGFWYSYLFQDVEVD